MIDLDAIEKAAREAARWGTGRWFMFHNPHAPHVPVTIRRGKWSDEENQLGPDASMRTFQRLPCDECGGDHVNGADRWHVAEMSPTKTRYHGCGRHGIGDAHQSILDEAAHIATCHPAAVLELISEVRRLRAFELSVRAAQGSEALCDAIEEHDAAYAWEQR